MNTLRVLLLFCTLLPSLCWAQEDSLCIPKCNDCSEILGHTAYYFSYNEAHEQARWVAYELKAEELKKKQARSNAFRTDPLVQTQTADNKDYKGSGYDRGHLAPAADMSWSKLVESESYYYSNMSPQDPSFNRGMWKKLEMLAREWALQNETLLIVTGPVLDSGLQKIGPNGVSVPRYFFKAILDATGPEKKAIGFLMRNEKLHGNLQNFVLSIDSLEKITQLDFFHALPDSIEDCLEETFDSQAWLWSTNDTTLRVVANPTELNLKSKCLGITKTGGQCKKTTSNASGFCHMHTNQAKEGQLRCVKLLKNGSRCKRKTKNSSRYCWQHE